MNIPIPLETDEDCRKLVQWQKLALEVLRYGRPKPIITQEQENQWHEIVPGIYERITQ